MLESAYTRLMACLMSGILLVSCANQSKETTGAVVGGAAGAAVGSQIGEGTGGVVATIIGAIAGGILGAKIGQQMDRQDRQNTAQALEQNEKMSWINSDTGAQYTVNPTDTFTNPEGEVCRQYTLDSHMNGETRRAQGLACRQPDGTWKTVE